MATDQLSRTFAALADPTRRALLSRLAEGEATVNELAEPFELSLQAISKHLRVLEDAGLLSKGRDAQRRPCQLTPDGLASATEWLEANRREWEDRLDRLGDHLRRLRSTKPAQLTTPDRTANNPDKEHPK